MSATKITDTPMWYNDIIGKTIKVADKSHIDEWFTQAHGMKVRWYSVKEDVQARFEGVRESHPHSGTSFMIREDDVIPLWEWEIREREKQVKDCIVEEMFEI
jgi:hypothetical protein